MEGFALLVWEAVPRPASAMGGREWSIEAAVRERGREPTLEMEPRGCVSKPGGAMKSSAVMPGAIWRLPRREVGLLRAIGMGAPSSGDSLGDADPPKGECQAGSDARRLGFPGRFLLESCGDRCAVPS